MSQRPPAAPSPALPPRIAPAVVAWQRSHGRQHLPWQHSREPYRVWLSEIMLQQTQVATVLNYYPRFLQQLPDVQSLAAAPQDQVMALWSGLGYYSRARNLHRCAQVVVEQHGGQFPRSSAALAQLPGIGRSTAAAIAAFCFDERAAILDANVKRVLTRVLAFGQDLASSANEKALWQLAEQLLPESPASAPSNHHSDMPAYTQGLMDLGASICLPRQPQCLLCPLLTMCRAAKAGQAEHYPVKTRKLKRRSESWWLLLMRNSANAVWLERRPSQASGRGIWAGLHSPPIYTSEDALLQALAEQGLAHAPRQHLAAQLHVLTHRDLHLHPVIVEIAQEGLTVAEPAPDLTPASATAAEGQWWSAHAWGSLGLPAPVRLLLQALYGIGSK